METKDIFERMAPNYDTAERVGQAQIAAEAMGEALAGSCGGSAIDYGCGTGLVGLALMDLFDSMLFVDLAPQMIRQVEQKLAGAKTEKASTLCCDFCEEEKLELKADCILTCQVLLHVKEPARLLERFYEILSPGGRLLLVDFDKNPRVSGPAHNGFEQSELIALCHSLGFSAAEAHTFYHGEKILMKEDASLFLLQARK